MMTQKVSTWKHSETMKYFTCIKIVLSCNGFRIAKHIFLIQSLNSKQIDFLAYTVYLHNILYFFKFYTLQITLHYQHYLLTKYYLWNTHFTHICCVRFPGFRPSINALVCERRNSEVFRQNPIYFRTSCGKYMVDCLTLTLAHSDKWDFAI